MASQTVLAEVFNAMMDAEAHTMIKLRSRNRQADGYSSSDPSSSSWLRDDDRVFIEHIVGPGDSLYKIGLQYSVPVSEIKRANNIHAEQEIHGLPHVRVPVTRLRQQLLQEKHQNDSTTPTVVVSDRAPLLTDADTDDDSSGSSAKSAIDAILDKADATVQQCRNQLPSPSLEGGAFHFVDASAPDHAAKGTLLLILGVVLIFVVVPLLLTMLEEQHEAEVELRHHQHEELLKHHSV